MPSKKTYVHLTSMLVVHSNRQQYVVHCQNVDQLGRLALQLLVEEHGTEGARLILRDEFRRYLRDFKGVGRDNRFPRLDREDVHAAQRMAGAADR